MTGRERETPVAQAALNAQELAVYLGIGRTAAYELMRSEGFPSLRIRTGKGRGSLRVMRSALDTWVEQQAGKAV